MTLGANSKGSIKILAPQSPRAIANSHMKWLNAV
jgi:hypothetical protein